MSTTRGNGVIYHWFDVPENQLENVESWTDAARKVREVTADIKKLAIATAPVGRFRIDGQTARIKDSHYQAAGIRKVFGNYQQVVGNRAPHALYVHEGTEGATGRTIHNKGRWMGPVPSDGGPGAVTLAGPYKKRSQVRTTRTKSARWRAHPHWVYFDYYVFNGQGANPWLADAGRLAYQLPGNH